MKNLSDTRTLNYSKHMLWLIADAYARLGEVSPEHIQRLAEKAAVRSCPQLAADFKSLATHALSDMPSVAQDLLSIKAKLKEVSP